MNTSIILWRKVSSTAPMTGRISPWAIPSFSHAAAVSSRRPSNVCMTRRRALGEHPHMGLQAQTAEKLAEGFGSHASFEAEHKERGHKQADEPGAACLRFPQRRLRGAVPAIHGLEVAMDAAFGKPGAIRQAPDALLAVCTNRVENDNTLGPQSHGVGPCSEGWLQLEKSALQSTRSTAGCPALRGCPMTTSAPRSLVNSL